MDEPNISAHIDGQRFAAAFKAVSATLGTEKTDTETHAMVWLSIWDQTGIELATFDGTRASVAFVPVGDGNKPEHDPDYRGSVRISKTFSFLATSAGASSDSIVVLKPYGGEQQALPGLEPPPGVEITASSALDDVAVRANGIQTTHDGVDWWRFIDGVTPSTTGELSASAETFAAVVNIAKVTGPLDIGIGIKDGGQVVTLTPAFGDELGFDFTALMSWSRAPSGGVSKVDA